MLREVCEEEYLEAVRHVRLDIVQSVCKEDKWIHVVKRRCIFLVICPLIL